MANQYKNALYYAAEQLQADLDKYNIVIHADERMIIYRDMAISIPFGSTKPECLRKLRKMIAIEKAEYKRKEATKLKERQVSLL